MTPIKIQVIVKVVLVVLFTFVCWTSNIVELQAINDVAVNGHQTNKTLSKKESSHDEIIIKRNEAFFSYLNETRSDEQLIKDLLDDNNLKPIGFTRNGAIWHSTNATSLDDHNDDGDNPLPPTRAPSSKLRKAGGYEAQEVAFKSPVSYCIHLLIIINCFVSCCK